MEDLFNRLPHCVIYNGHPIWLTVTASNQVSRWTAGYMNDHGQMLDGFRIGATPTEALRLLVNSEGTTIGSR